MAWCCHATSHYLSKCWHRFMMAFGVTRPQWVKSKCCDISTRVVIKQMQDVCMLELLSTRKSVCPHICVGKLTTIGSDNALLPGWRQAIIWTNAGILLIGTLGTNFSEILIEIHPLSVKKMGLNVSSAKWRPFCLGLNVLIPKCWHFGTHCCWQDHHLSMP